MKTKTRKRRALISKRTTKIKNKSTVGVKKKLTKRRTFSPPKKTSERLIKFCLYSNWR